MRRITPFLALAIGLGADTTFGIVYAETQAERWQGRAGFRRCHGSRGMSVIPVAPA